MCTIIPVSQLTMSEVWSSVQHLQVLSFCPDVVSNDLTSCVVVQRFTPTTSTEEQELIQIRHRDISTKNKTVTLLANILQRLTEQHVVLCSTKRYKTTKQGWFYCKGWCLGRPLHRFLRYLRLLKPNRKQCGCDVESCAVCLTLVPSKYGKQAQFIKMQQHASCTSCESSVWRRGVRKLSSALIPLLSTFVISLQSETTFTSFALGSISRLYIWGILWEVG